MALLCCKGILKSAKLGTIKLADLKPVLDSLLIEDPDEEEKPAVKVETVPVEDKASH
jgi:hypothetical protein